MKEREHSPLAGFVNASILMALFWIAVLIFPRTTLTVVFLCVMGFGLVALYERLSRAHANKFGARARKLLASFLTHRRAH